MRIITQNYCDIREWDKKEIAAIRAEADVLIIVFSMENILSELWADVAAIANVKSIVRAYEFDIKKTADQLPWRIASLTDKHLPSAVLCFLDQWKERDLLLFLRKDCETMRREAALLPLDYKDVYRLLYKYSLFYYQSGVLATDFCNLRCNMCMFHSQDREQYNFFDQRRKDRSPQQISEKSMYAYMDQLMPASTILFSASGEFLTSDHSLEYVSYAAKINLNPMVLTNGLLLTEEKVKVLVDSGVSQFIISVDGHRSELYRRHREGGDFNKVVQNIVALRSLRQSMRKSFSIVINTVLFKEFEPDTMRKQILEFWTGKADKVFFLVERVDYCGKPRKLLGDFSPIRMCFEPLTGPILLSNGLIAPCCSVAIAEWYEDFPWLLHIEQTTIGDAMRHYRDLMLDPQSPLRRYCDKCHYWANSMQHHNKSPYWVAYDLPNVV